jgi:drug/metabolite transporter (DMT)-like permease
MIHNQRKAYLFATLSILAWSSISTAFKLSLQGLSPIGLLWIASFTAALFLGISCLVVYRLPQTFSSALKTFGQNARKSLLPAALNPFLYYLILFEAYSRLRAQEAQALNYTWAIVLAMFGIWLLKEKFRLLDLFALLLSFFGVWLISAKGAFTSVHFDDLGGSVMAVCTSFIWAGYWIINLKDKRPAVQKLFFNFLLGFVFITLLVLIRKPSLISQAGLLKQGLFAGIYVGVFEMGLTFLLWFKALEYTKSTAAISNLIFLTPFISLLFIRLLLQESIHPATFAGLILIVISNLAQKSISHSKRKA